jgi:hypothetical protein
MGVRSASLAQEGAASGESRSSTSKPGLRHLPARPRHGPVKALDQT